MYNRLGDVRADVARRLAEGADKRQSAMHSAVVATADADARVMILRAFDADDWTLRFHTDVRAPKCDVIVRDPRIGALFYDAPGKVQLRVRGRARIESEGEVADAAWAASANFARRCYLGEGPGAIAPEPTSGLPEWIEGREPEDAQVVPARENFAVLIVTIETVDWYHLANTGHRRALLRREGGDWLTP